jgi:hypothetical protein
VEAINQVAKFKRKADTNFDVDKSVVICAKGPTFDLFSQYNFDDCYITSLTTTANLIEQNIDFLFFNDIEAFKQIKDETFDRVSNVVCPLILHENEEPSREYTSGYVRVALEDKDLNIFTYRLHTQQFTFKVDHKEQDSSMLNEGQNHSVLDTAISWFISLGFYKFILIGVSDEAEYAEDFGKDKEKAFVEREEDWYQFNFAVTTHILDKNGCKAALIKNEDGEIMGLNCQASIEPMIKIK